ncbi:MAG TPA: heme lyase CcmF/NrfE family subunit [Afifellaceae bacterium]|nr:heme lyase CcmF/NrfE family subunit [Afifellaceae bacterium]
MGAFPAAELGHYALILALVISLVQSTLPMWGAHVGDERLMAIAPAASIAGLAYVGFAFAALTYAYVTSDFSVLNVWENSHSDKPMLFKVTGVWGNHEGSMLLWVLILALFGALVALFSRNLPDTLRARVLAVQGWIGASFLLFILMTSNPFARIENPPLEGRDLNPILQDIGLAIHPPMLYLGYVGFSISFAFAVAALIDGRIDAAWARWVRPWTLTAWMFLTAGIAMGSYWAYYELGWGGWWFWDPVENVSFMPWLAGTALLHSAIVMEKRGALKIWTILLAILAFSLSLLGTFIVRSGLLTSVHTFAADPDRGLFILLILMTFIGGSLILFAWRAPMMKQGGLFQPISREGALVFNNIFILFATAAVLLGTLYPIGLEALTDRKISVGPPYFNKTFAILMLPVLLAMPFGPMLAWKRADLAGVAQRLGVAMLVAIAGAAVAFALSGAGSPLPAIGIGLAVWLIIGALTDLAERIRLFRVPPGVSLSRLAGLPRAVFGGVLAHGGVGVMLIGIVSVTSFGTEDNVIMQPGGTIDYHGTLQFDGMVPRSGPNYREEIARFNWKAAPETEPVMLTPSRRFYTARQSSTTEAAIHNRGFSQIYLTIGESRDDGGLVVKAYYKPQVTLIWIGALIMAAGGLVSLTDRRLRIGAPKRARARSPEARQSA